MKRLLLIPIFLLVFGCSNDDNPQENNCGKITGRGWSYTAGWSFTVNNERILVPIGVYEKYQLGDTYCK